MKMLNRLLLLLLVFAGTAAQAQTGAISGRITDAATKAPIYGASIQVAETEYGAGTDERGNYTIRNLKPGTYLLLISCMGSEDAFREVVVSANRVSRQDVALTSTSLRAEEVVVVARANRESENVLLLEQKEALAMTVNVGALEMSRKGVGDAQAAVAQVSGVSRQEGVKNVFVRGLGDRYNATLLNGFPVPSEDPEYKNIALEFFGSDIIKSIGVSKVFDARSNGDVGGAVIDIASKELFGMKAFSASLDAGIDSRAVGADLLRQDGVNFLGFSDDKQPSGGRFDFPNGLDPHKTGLPLNYSVGLSGGRFFDIGGSPLSFFVVASHAADHSFTKETVRKIVYNGAVIQDQTGEKSTIGTDQLVLANVKFRPRLKHELNYNFMLLHANEQYVGRYYGFHAETYQSAHESRGFLMRQQSNDNLLFTHQLISKWKLSPRLRLDAGAALNDIRGTEPDRRENHLSLQSDGRYDFTASDRQQRSFSELNENDLNLHAGLLWALDPDLDIERSNVSVGYKGRFVDHGFKATRYGMSAYPGHFDLANIHFDDLYNDANYQLGTFTMTKGDENRYDVTKNIHSLYLEASHRITDRLSANVGVRADLIDQSIDYYVDAHGSGYDDISESYILPSLNLKYDLDERSSLRLGLSKSYILPRAKEIAPYQYVNVGFASEGNPALRPSDCYNVDLRWDLYPSPSEFFAVGLFFKHIVDPIGRVDEGGSAHLLSYDNLSPSATVAGIEIELRKNLVANILSAGLNASYIFSRLELDVENTAKRTTELEGASPFILNGDLSCKLDGFLFSVVANYTSDRINTLGTLGYHDIIEKGIVTLSAVSSYKVDDRWSVKLKAGNLLDPSFRLTQKWGDGTNKTTLSEYRKGIDLSLGISFTL